MKLDVFLKGHKSLLKNFSYITAMQFFILLAPLITYPYLVRVLGQELYGIVLSAQMLASYASIIIDFGSNGVCAKHVSMNRNDKNKVSEIVNSVFIVRLVLLLSSFFLYMAVVFLVPQYREFWILFALTYGLTLNDLLFPQYYFQGIEHMKTITMISIITKLLFIGLVFFVVRSPEDYLLVPVLYTMGFALGGIISIYIIYKRHKLKLFIPNYATIKFYIKDCSPLFANDLVCTVKDKLNYMFVGIFAGMSDVVIYDLGLKLHSLLTKPMQILTTVLLPRFAVSRNVSQLKKVIVLSFSIAFILVIVTNIFLPEIVEFFIHKKIDLLPLRAFLIAPLLVSVSSVISSNLFIAFGYNKYVLYSIIVTTVAYILMFLFLLLSGRLNSIYAFVALALLSYFTEFLYRLLKAKQIIKKETNHNIV
jgi:PST family polysaccharide transporter